MAEGAPVSFTGVWKLESTTPNFEDLLKAMNVGFAMRKAIVNLSPEITIKQDGDDFVIITKTAIMSREAKFKVGEEYTQKHPLKGVDNTLLATWEGQALVQKVVSSEDEPVITRTMEDGKMVVKQTFCELEVSRVFSKKE